MDKIKNVRNYLKDRNPQLEIILLKEDISTAFLAAQALGTEVGQIAKSILFKTKDDRFLMVVSAGDVKIDSKAVKNLTGSRVRMANAEEVEEITGFNIGGVCPFALKQEVPIFLDESLKRYEIVYTAAGTSNTALPISFEELCRVTGGQTCKVS
ncbi:MAG: YbaK/EbsC family protein [Syntrophomonadaceae bacterium]|nr:YbaK/EbsC family protein [Syntrophomonadaceae bacterium]